MTATSSPVQDRSSLERAWAVPIVLAAAAACVNARPIVWVLALLAAALVPWVLSIGGRVLPGPLFGVVSLLPVIGISVLSGLNGSQFLATTVLCQLASRAVRSWHILVLGAVGAVIPFLAYLHGPPFDPGAIYFAIGNQFGIVVGRLLGRTRRLGEELRAADARIAASEALNQRTQLARDVHDLVAHSLTVVLLQLGGARRVLRTNPDTAEAALAQAEHVGRESLDGIREIVGLLRTDEPNPRGSLDITHLVDTYRAASVPIDLDDEGSDQMPLLVRGTLYRVAREALANAARYRTGHQPVRVHVRIRPAGALLEIANSGTNGKRSKPGGYGLAGLREQVTAIGGTLDAGPINDGWLVSCHLPRDASIRGVASS